MIGNNMNVRSMTQTVHFRDNLQQVVKANSLLGVVVDRQLLDNSFRTKQSRASFIFLKTVHFTAYLIYCLVS